MTEKIYFYPVWVRLWHIINALACLMLIITGISLQYASLNMFINFHQAIIFHNIAGVIIAFNYLIFIIGNGVTKNGIYYKFSIKTLFQEILKQLRYYTFGMFKGEKAPFPLGEDRKFNPLQKFTYVSIMYILIPIIIITGLAMLFPEIIATKIFGVSGFFLVDMFHVSVGFLISIFLMIHIYFATIGGKNNFKAIATGWHEEHE